MEIEIELDPDDWTTLRWESRSWFDILGGDCMSGPARSPYTWFEGTLWIDGEEIDQVSVRKKGFIGSLSTTKPGMKVEFDELVEDRRIHGMERMALNNTPQDPTMLRTCLAYDYFNRAGVPAPRCGFAHMVVNGEDLGIYATVQVVDDHFLAEHGVGPDAPLFEGALSDFRDGWLNTFDLDSPTADTSLLEPIQEAIESGDLTRIESLIDLEDFIRFWVAEVAVAQWDGFGWNANNFFLYIDPEDGLARFVPWGPDAAWSSANPGGGLDWISLNNSLVRALVAHPEVELLYREEVARQVSEAGGVEENMARIAAFANLIAPWHRDPDARSSLEWLATNQLNIMAASEAAAWPAPTYPLRAPLCMVERGTISYSFEGEWGSSTGMSAPGVCDGIYTWDGVAYSMNESVLYAGEQDGWSSVVCQHFPDSSGTVWMPYNVLPSALFGVGSIQTDHTVRYAYMYYTNSTMGYWADLSWIEGTLAIESFDPTGTVRGSFEGTLWSPPW
jgi:hypothetical protein